MGNPPARYPVKIGLIYGYAPSGHYSAARALADFFPAAIIEPVFINLSEVYPNLGPFVAKTYIEVLKKTPFLWNYVYDNDFVAFAAGALKNTVLSFYSQKLSALLAAKNIKAVISTQALSAMLIAKCPALKNTPLFAVLTDFRAHSYWPSENVAGYFVPSKISAQSLIKNGADPSKIFAAGIPVRKEFLTPRDTRSERRALGLSPQLFTILITGGSRGMGEIFSAIEALAPFFGRLQIMAMCGENKVLSRRLSRIQTRKKYLKIIDYTDSPSAYYAAADLVVAKPGGVTVAETLSLGKPLIIFSPLPGQEELNASFLIKNRLAELAKDGRQLQTLVKRRLDVRSQAKDGPDAGQRPSEPRIKELSSFAKPCAARDIVAAILEKIIKN